MDVTNAELKGEKLPVYNIIGVRKLDTNHFWLSTDEDLVILTGFMEEDHKASSLGFAHYYVEVWKTDPILLKFVEPIRMYTDRDTPHARVVFWAAMERYAKKEGWF
jgi:hypothetical protein